MQEQVYKEIKQVGEVYDKELSPAKEEAKTATNKLTEATNDLNTALDVEEQTIKDVSDEAGKMGEIVQDTANKAIEGFSNAVRTSVITAFLYL